MSMLCVWGGSLLFKDALKPQRRCTIFAATELGIRSRFLKEKTHDQYTTIVRSKTAQTVLNNPKSMRP